MIFVRNSLKTSKTTIDIFCAFTSFLVLLFENVVHHPNLLSLCLSYRLTHSWGRKPILICGLTLVFSGSMLTTWFSNIIFEFIRLVVKGCGTWFLYKVGVPMYSFIYVYDKYDYSICQLI